MVSKTDEFIISGKRDTIKRKIKFVQINIGFHLKSDKFYSDWIRVKIELIKKNYTKKKIIDAPSI